jgi:hypothetical protein
MIPLISKFSYLQLRDRIDQMFLRHIPQAEFFPHDDMARPVLRILSGYLPRFTLLYHSLRKKMRSDGHFMEIPLYFVVFLPRRLVSFGMILMGDWRGCLNAYVCTHFGGSSLAFGMVWAGEWKWVRMFGKMYFMFIVDEGGRVDR